MARRTATAKPPPSVVPLIGYVRVSTIAGRVDERFKSPDIQREVMSRWAKLRYGVAGHRWVAWFEDLDFTGSNIDRPQLNAARDCAVESQGDIVVYDLTRYSRSVPEGLSALAALGESGVDVISASEDIDSSTPEGELSLTMFLAMSQYQLRRTSTSWRNAIARNKDEGWWHGVAPYGYRRPTVKEATQIGRRSGVIVVDDVAASHVKEIFRRYLSGDSTYSIGMYAVANGWFRQLGNVKSILGNPAYAGMIVHAEYVLARSKKTGKPLLDKKGRKLRRRVAETERWSRGRHEPIISAKDVVLARARLRREAKPAFPKHTAARWSAAGRTKCDGCGRNLTFHDKSKEVTGSPGFYLVCKNRDCHNKPGSVRVDHLDQLISNVIHELPFRVRDVREEMEARSRVASSSELRSSLKAEATKLRTRVAEVAAMMMSGSYTEHGLKPDEATAGLELLRKQSSKVERDLEQLGPEPNSTSSHLTVSEDIDLLASLWGSMLNNERADALESLGAWIRVRPSRKYSDDLEGRVILSLPFDPSAVFEARRRAAVTVPYETP